MTEYREPWVGDVIRLKTGGENMTVVETGPGTVIVQQMVRVELKITDIELVKASDSPVPPLARCLSYMSPGPPWYAAQCRKVEGHSGDCDFGTEEEARHRFWNGKEPLEVITQQIGSWDTIWDVRARAAADYRAKHGDRDG